MDLSALIQAAHGGDAVNSIAAKFGLTPEQASAAIDALAPALAQGVQNHLSTSEGFGQILGHLNDPAHQASYDDADAATSPAATQAGTDLLHQIFGNPAAVQQIAQHIGQEVGINPAILNELMPVVASMTAGGVSKALQDSGLGGLLSQVSSAAGQQGGLGSILGSVAQAALGGNQQGGLGGMIGNVVGSLFGHSNASAAAPATADGAAPAGGLDPAIVQAGMSALSGLFQSGQASSGLQNVLGQIFAKR